MTNWGEALAALGYMVIVPDYRGLGASGGERGQCFPEEHIDDIRSVPKPHRARKRTTPYWSE